MAKAKSVIDVLCPCCQTTLKVDTATGMVLSHKQPERPRPIEDLAVAVANLKVEASRREDIFQKSVQDHKVRQSVLDRKFDELLKQAKESPDEAPPKRAFDFE
jgi:hypothetical protein